MRHLFCFLLLLMLGACTQEAPAPTPTTLLAEGRSLQTPTPVPAPPALLSATPLAAPPATPSATPTLPATPQATQGPVPPPAPLEWHRARLHPALPAPDLARLPRYVISATLAPPRLYGTFQLTLPPTTEALESVVLRLYGNGQSMYSGSQLRVSEVRVGGAGVTAQVEAGGSALRVPLPTSLPSELPLTLTLNFESEVASGSFRGYGIQQMAQGIAVFGSPFPLLALRDGAEWRVPAIPQVGDAVSSPVALWDVFIRLPQGGTLVSTGETVGQVGEQLHIVSGPARDVALVLLPEGSVPLAYEVEGVTLRYWPAGYVRESTFPAQDAAAVAAATIQIMSAEFGPAPYRELDVVEAQVPIGGYEYPGLVLFDGRRRALADRDGIDFLIPHEIAHQWFYALVGNDVTREPWIDEGLATFAQLRYLHRVRGAEAAQQQRRRWEAEYASVLQRRPVGVNRPLFGYSDWVSYRGPTYYASALLFDEIRQRLGEVPFTDAMQRLVTRHAFGEVQGAELRAIFDEVAAEQGVSLADLWQRYLE